MKLYATTTSERASKGQGGNKFLKVEFQIEQTNPTGFKRYIDAGDIDININNGVIEIDYISQGGNVTPLANFKEDLQEKGKKQKGEKICSVIGCLNKSKYHYQFEDLCELHNKQ